MIRVDILILSLNEADTLKVSIWESIIKHKKVYHAKYININLEFYQNLSKVQKENYYGIDYREENGGPIIYYLDIDSFMRDLPEAMKNGPRLKTQLV